MMLCRPIGPTATAVFWMALMWLLPMNGQAKVLELSDRFLPMRNEGHWLIMFYAPWCGHCKKLEPIYHHVDQSLSMEQIRVARIDCTRFPSVATEFAIKGYPTILFLKDGVTFSYDGDRNREDIVAFARRLMGPPVKELKSEQQMKEALQDKDINFVFIGTPIGSLWNTYQHTATAYQQHEFFYQVPSDVAEKFTNRKESQAIRVFKDKTSFLFRDLSLTSDDSNERQQRSLPDDAGDTPTHEEEDNNLLPSPEATPPTNIENEPLYSWIAQERFPMFMKVTRGKFSHLLSTKKFLVIAVLEENKIGQLTTPEMEDFRDLMSDVAERTRHHSGYHEHFQFGWTGTPDLANSVAMDVLELPNLLVVNASSLQHHLPDDDPLQLTPEAVIIFLDQVLQGTAPVYGGSSYTVRLYRSYFEAKSSILEMWKGNPALTAVLFGLPLGFFSLICYSICCADIMDADEEDEEEEGEYHEKTD